MDLQAAKNLCQKLERDLMPLDHEVRLAQWDAETTGSEEAFRRVEEGQKRCMRRLADRDDYKLADALRHDKSLDDETRRQLERWRNRMAPNQIDGATIDRLAAEEAALVQQYNAFRADLGGRSVGDNEIDRILSESTNSAEVEKAWRASKRISEFKGESELSVVDRLRDLVRLRNEAARQIGYSNAYVSALELSELDPKWLFETLEELDAATRPLFMKWKEGLDAKLAERFGIEENQLRPWHYGDRFFQSPPRVNEEINLDPLFKEKDVVELTNKTFDALGFDIRSIVKKSDLFPGDPKTSRKCQHAFCTTIEAPTDVRVLCNIVPGARWMSTNLHEFGHAVYGASLDPDAPYILRDDAHLLANESIALLMERHLLNEQWLERIAGVPKAEAERIAAHGQQMVAVKHLVFTRWVLVMCHFERALYENPDREDLGKLWWDIVEEYQLLTRPEPDRFSHDWAAKIHFVGYPAYYQNYLLGEIFGTQLQEAVTKACGGVFLEPSAGAFLVEKMFRPGARYPWRELIERISGIPFSLTPFLEVVGHA
ncbi:M2 family metallopeptidase [bacterium]|nr:M2 family metallopeptidase [bacterium]